MKDSDLIASMTKNLYLFTCMSLVNHYAESILRRTLIATGTEYFGRRVTFSAELAASGVMAAARP